VKLLIAETIVVKVYFEVLYWLLCLKRLNKTTKNVLLTNTNGQLKILVFAVGQKQFCCSQCRYGNSKRVEAGIRCFDSLTPRICHILYEPFYST